MGSNFARKRPNSLKRSRALKRGGVRFEPFGEAHLPYAWAAYRRGSFEKRGIVLPGRDSRAFREELLDYIAKAQESLIEAWVAYARTAHGEIPVALVMIGFSEDAKVKVKVGMDTVLAHPSIIWYPEATPRNRLEVSIMLLKELKKEYLVLMAVREPDARFLRHLGKYGLVRAVGKIRDYFKADEDAMLFQTVSK